jgi:hypothetical protein
MPTSPPPPPADDFNIEVELEVEPASSAALDLAALQAELRRLQRRIVGFESANAELSTAPNAAALWETWQLVSTWGFEDADPGDGVTGILAEAEAATEAGARAQAALAQAASRLSHLRRIPCRDCLVIPCPACTEAAGQKEPTVRTVVRRAPLDEKK